MNKQYKKIVILTIILIFLYIRDTLSLRYRGWVLYFTPSCPYCVTQLNEFGWKSAILNKVNCEQMNCPNVKAYPTWINSKTQEQVEGVVSIEELADKLP